MGEETEDDWRARFEADKLQIAEARAEAARYARVVSVVSTASWVLLVLAVVGWVVVVYLS